MPCITTTRPCAGTRSVHWFYENITDTGPFLSTNPYRDHPQGIYAYLFADEDQGLWFSQLCTPVDETFFRSLIPCELEEEINDWAARHEVAMYQKCLAAEKKVLTGDGFDLAGRVDGLLPIPVIFTPAFGSRVAKEFYYPREKGVFETDLMLSWRRKGRWGLGDDEVLGMREVLVEAPNLKGRQVMSSVVVRMPTTVVGPCLVAPVVPEEVKMFSAG